ncbi:right-handed parallel beta-helix repeat-containing protein [[Clostridium] leptum]|nr:right-handed parallel beta-helix repeat-containing protein [[Clostridium] leptum]
MNTTKTTKRSLLVSGLAVFMCIAMLAGTTFAWFTDSVVNKGNRIQSGTLLMDVIGYDRSGTEIGSFKDDSTPALISEVNWEPGVSNSKYIKVINNGTLSFDFQMKFVIQPGDESLIDSLWYNLEEVDEITQLSAQPTSKDDRNDMNGLGDTTIDSTLLKGETKIYRFDYGMKEEAGNEFQNKEFSADLSLVAKQHTYEEDGFGNNQYDKDAPYPVTVNSNDELADAMSQGNGYVVLSDDFDAETINLSSSTKAISNMVLDGNGKLLKGMDVDASTSIDGLTIQNFDFVEKGISLVAWGEQAGFKNVTIRNCNFKDMAETSNSAIHLNVAADVVENFTVENCVIDGVSSITGSGIYVGSSSGSIVVTGCTIKDVAHSGIQISGNSNGSITIKNNTIENWNCDNDSESSGGGYGINAVYREGDGRFASITNNIFKKTFVEGSTDAGKIIRMRYATFGLKDVDLNYESSLGDLSGTYYEVIGNDYSQVSY